MTLLEQPRFDIAARILVAADVPGRDKLDELLGPLPSIAKSIKTGMELIDGIGLSAIDDLSRDGYSIFDDAKICDIPQTVENTARVHVKHHPMMLNCMASIGVEGMRRFANVCREAGVLSVAVTVLTTKTDAECMVEYGRTAKEQVLIYADWALEAGIQALVCSPLELTMLRALSRFDGIMLITPGIRPEYAQANDQKRTMTPGEAILAGADFLVIGRPITSTEYGTVEENFMRIYDEVKQARDKLFADAVAANAKFSIRVFGDGLVRVIYFQGEQVLEEAS